MTRRAWLVLGAILLGALLVRVVVALALPNAVWPDEVFQTSEQAHRLAFGDGLIPWEFRDGARSWLLPGALAGIYKLSGPFYLGAAAFALSLVSLVPLAALFRSVHARDQRLLPAIAATVVAATWFELVYFAPKALNEVVAAHFLVAAVLLVPRRLVVAGAFAGLAVGLRIHLAPTVAVLAAIVLYRQRRRAVAFLGAMVGVLLVAGLLDWITWGVPFGSYLTTIRINIFEHRAELWGVAPWSAYLTAFARTWGVWGLVVLALAGLGARRDPVPFALALVTLLVHAAIGHKEYRFAVPVIALAMTSAGLGAAELASRAKPWQVAGGLAIWCAVSLLLASAASTRTSTLSIAFTPAGSPFANQRGELLATRRAGELERLCGVGLVQVPWYLTGGYAWLHRSVPIEEIENPAQLQREVGALDALIAPEALELPPPYANLGCEAGTCVWQRPGGCTKPSVDYRDITPR